MNATTMTKPMMQAPMVQAPMMQAPKGCWQNFVSGAKASGSWCATKIQAGASAAWQGAKKVVALAAGFFYALGARMGAFIKLHARELTIAGVAFGAGVAVALLFRHFCCKPAETTTLLESSKTVILEDSASDSSADSSETGSASLKTRSSVESKSVLSGPATKHPVGPENKERIKQYAARGADLTTIQA
jgi:hypothetical protein